jgi:hypothetical protein
LSGIDAERRNAQALADLVREQPELVLVSRWHAFPPDHPVPQWLTAHYVTIESPALALPAKDFSILVRKGGALEQRLQAGVQVTAATTR